MEPWYFKKLLNFFFELLIICFQTHMNIEQIAQHSLPSYSSTRSNSYQLFHPSSPPPFLARLFLEQIPHIISYPPVNILEDKHLSIFLGSFVAGFDLWYVTEQAQAVPNESSWGIFMAVDTFFCVCVPSPKRISMLRNPNITLMVAQTTEEKWHVVMTLWWQCRGELGGRETGLGSKREDVF